MGELFEQRLGGIEGVDGHLFCPTASHRPGKEDSLFAGQSAQKQNKVDRQGEEKKDGDSNKQFHKTVEDQAEKTNELKG